MDGLKALEVIMRETPTPVLMLSSLTSDGGEITLKALEMGAVDFVDKSTCHTTMDIIELADTIIEKIKTIAEVNVDTIIETAEPEKIPEIVFQKLYLSLWNGNRAIL